MYWRRLTSAVAVFVCAAGAGCDGCGGTIDSMRDGSMGRPDGHYPDGAVVPGDSAVLPSDIVLFAPGTTHDVATHFSDPPSTTAVRPAVLYPLDGVLFPRNVFAPDVQWDGGGNPGDVFRVTFTGAPISLTAYVSDTGSSFGFDYLIDPASWATLADVGAGSTMTLTVDRWDTASHTVALGTPIHVRVARAGIAGAVYYWELGAFGGAEEGRIFRVRQGTSAAPTIEDFMPTPPPGSDGARCSACHGLSRDGNHLAVALHDGSFGGVFDLTTDLTGASPPSVFTFSQPWYFAAFSPDGSRILMTDPSQNSHLLDGATGAEIMPPGGVRDGTHPAWSPDGNQIAIVVHADDGWNPTVGDLATSAVSGDSFAAAALLHTGSDLSGMPEGGALDAYPSYSPDSRIIVFQHGTHTLASAAGATGALYAIPRDGGAAVRLDHASVGDALYPNFTPFTTAGDTGGQVFWLLQYSRRDYGNTQVGTRGTHRRQIWVSAISTDISAGDPSNVPYWLPGQDTAQENASAFWAPVPCRSTGDSCTSGSQCCTAVCGPDGASDPTCLPPTTCRMEGETCSASSDCCGAAGYTCAGGVCIGTLI